jgi:glycosyltransferase involved in cell wall biosynthesis
LHLSGPFLFAILGQPMRIAQVSPLYESVPPQQYGGTERVVSYLTEELIRQGHEVTLFASGDSKTAARLIAPCPRSLRTDPQCIDPIIAHLVMLEDVCRRADQFDVVHFHVDYLHFPFSRRERFAHLTTLHGRLDIPELRLLYAEYADEALVSISQSQRKPLPHLPWLGTVYHGLPEDLYAPRFDQGGYLAFLGRMSPEKRVDRAIEIATRLGMPLKIAAKVDRNDRDHFHEHIEPLLDNPLVEFVGEIGDSQKSRFLGEARALLFPIDWPEPFGLAMIESMACGTPVIAWRCGSVPEVVDEGITGSIAQSIDEAVEAVRRVGTFSRQRCYETFLHRFSVSRMCRDYLRLYRHLAKKQPLGRPPRRPPTVTPG